MGHFPIIPLYFVIFRVFIPLYFIKKRGCYSSLFYHFLGIYTSLFYQKVVSLHADVMCFFSDLNKIIEYMYIQRTIDKYLLEWKNAPTHKPLLLRGARQVGKSSAIRQLGKAFK